MQPTPWFTRQFNPISDNGLWLNILERLAGTPLRLAAKAEYLNETQLMQKWEDKWSIKEEMGHLGDLESLWLGRFEELIANKSELRSADLSNTLTHQANHNDRSKRELIGEFAKQRTQLMQLLAQFEPTHLDNTALHPRLKTPMKPIDLAFFVAEHDDHHLAMIQWKVMRLKI